MKTLITLPALLLSLSLLAAPVDLIIDCDIGNDVDDVFAIAIAHQEMTAGNCNLLAVTTTKDHPNSAPFLRLLNRYYGRPDIPVGAVTNGVTRDENKYLQIAAKEPAAQTLEAVRLLRKLLAAAKDGSITIAQIGFSTNLARLLDTDADDLSPLTGKELAASKVKLLSIMAGDFANPNSAEFNVKCDIPAAQKLAKNWPGKIVFSGFEVGKATCFPSEFVEQSFLGDAANPLRESYRLYCGFKHDRPCWDLTSVYYAIHTDTPLYTLSPAGHVTFDDRGFTIYRPDPKGRHYYMNVNPDQIQKNIELFKKFCAAPPTK